jgi:tetratricopeptide (TPR) repeat protein
MILFSKRPIIHEKAIQQALEAMRAGRRLHAHPLQISLIIASRLASPHAVGGEAAAQVAIFDYLREIITGRLAELRQVYQLPPPAQACADSDLAADFSQNNRELESWSLLYHRYVCVDRDLSMQQIGSVTGRDQRLLRHRQARAISRLTEISVAREQAARQQETIHRLRLALPGTHPPNLVGIESLLETALHFLTEGDPPRHLVFHGPEGIGKSALAEVAAHRMVDDEQLEDLLWFTVPESVPSPAALVHGLVEGLGLPASGGTNPTWALRAYLLTHPTLVVLDQADALLTDAAYAGFLLETLDSANVILTSRVAPSSDLWCYLISLPGLNREQAFEFLRTVARQRNRRDDEQRLQAIWAAVGGNPVMLRAVFNISPTFPLATALARAGITDLYDHIWRQLSPDDQRVSLIALLFSRKGLTYQQVSLLSRLSQDRIDQAILQLLDRAFLTVEEDAESFVLSPPAATFLLGHIQDDLAIGDGESAVVFLRRAFRRRVEELVDAPDPEAAVALLKLANRLGFSDVEAWEHTFNLAPQITAAGRWLAWHQHLTTLLDYEYAAPQAAWLGLTIGIALRWLGQLDDALIALERARVYYTDEASPHQAEVMGELAVIYRYRGEWRTAGLLLQAALDLYERFDIAAGVERCLHELAQLDLEQGHAEQVLDWLGRLERRTVRSWGIAGQAYALLGQRDLARDAARHIQDLLEEYLAEDSSNYGRAVATLGLIYDRLDEPAIAAPYLSQAVDLLERAKDMAGYARACNNLSVAYLKQPVHSREVPLSDLYHLLTSALDIQGHIGDKIGLAITQQNLSLLSLANPAEDTESDH